MKLLKKLLIILLISIIVIFSLIPPKVVKAETTLTPQEEVGYAIASVAEDFYNRFADMTIYDCGRYGGYDNPYTDSHVEEFWGRKEAYKNNLTSGIAYDLSGKDYPYENKYAIDCVGFVNIIIGRVLRKTGFGSQTFKLYASQGPYEIKLFDIKRETDK